MTNLFDEPTGFRLARLEIYNWGTFDGEIWTMIPDTRTAVLTGANGSGKSTVVDALLTLLVEPRQRNYNLASGAGSSRERNERTYVRGYYSRSRGDSAVEAKANTLRDAQSYSVLLGVFQDTAKNRTVTLAQVLWISNADRVEKRYYVAACDLTIEQHFSQRHVTARDLPQALEYFGSSFKDYITATRKSLGLAGRLKALDLFNETAAVKDIDSLNTFVREHMLDKGNPEAKVEALRTQYRELNDAHAAIQRATKQINILAPLVKAGSEYRRYETQIERYTVAKTLVPFYVADRACAILNDAIRTTQSKRDTEQSRLTGVDRDLQAKREDLQRVSISIASDNVGQEKREIEGQIRPLKGEIDALKRAADQYDNFARLLDLPTYQHEDDFSQNRHQAQQSRETVEARNTELDQERFSIQTQLNDRIGEGQRIDNEIQFLKNHPSNIPPGIGMIRHEISAALNISPEELPFVGELLRVRAEALAWEGALERLLHSFALNLIVPEVFYAKVSRYINDHRLGGRLVYRRVDPNRPVGRLPERSEQRIVGELAYDKLQVIEKTPFNDWLATSLMRQFDYVCTETLADFQQAEKAITLQGQIKHSASRHEKDDRHDLQDRHNYVLGWDNREKLRQLERELDDLHRQVNSLQEKTTRLQAEMERGQKDIRALENLLAVAAFRDIDWRAPQSEYDRLQRRLLDLNQQSQQLQQLERQRDTLQQQIKEVEGRRDRITGEVRSLTDKVEGYSRGLHDAEQQLAAATPETQAQWKQVQDVLAETDKAPLTIATVNSRASELEVSIQRSISSFKGIQNNFESEIRNAINLFRMEYPDEGASLTADLASLDAFEKIHHRLKTDDLSRYESRFKEMLDRTVTRGIQVFLSSLTETDRDIDRSIHELNESLAQVDYGGGSIIRLIAEPTSDVEVRDFRQELRTCIPNAGDSSPEELTRSYNRIQALIQHFDADPNWMKRVIDVRRWRVFAAEQIDTTGQQLDYYNDSSGKSGGQKVKLAYTILASAIAHQYGLQDPLSNERSFRFVVIDEAFSKLDGDNAGFAMKLFEQLGLQLLVVTPMQQLYVIENYVHAYHVVVNNAEGSCSRLFNLTQTEFRQRRREFQTRPD